MKAITVRQAGVLIAFGPAGRGYDPGVPDGAVKAIEDDYNTVQDEYIATHPSKSADEVLADTLVQILQNPVNRAKLRSALGI